MVKKFTISYRVVGLPAIHERHAHKTAGVEGGINERIMVDYCGMPHRATSSV